MVLTAPGPLERGRLELRELALPEPRPDQVLVKVHSNAVCRTDLHVIEGELSNPKLPLVPGHQIVGTVEQAGERVSSLTRGDRVGVPWLGGTCGICPYCVACSENLCDAPSFTGYQLDGGYAEYALARADFVLPLPPGYPDLQAAPLLCAGLIGYRALRMAHVEPLSDVARLGLYGFGASAHIVIQVARHLGYETYVFTRGEQRRRFAMELGATWAGSSGDLPDVKLDSAIVFAPAGELVPRALATVRKGGVVVCAGIHMSPIPRLDYELLWGERVVRSVANLTRRDGHEFLELAVRFALKTEVEVFPLEQATEVLLRVKRGEVRGAAVLQP